MVELKLTLDQALLVAEAVGDVVEFGLPRTGHSLNRRLSRGNRQILVRAASRIERAIDESLDAIDCAGGL
ncbi:MAG: hypothetical protein JSV86_16865 [Gemmatimonadota bacterium]|nr:MAG: hypothetical protein JSV86_16865 [Gemmatimonadota bacterium]